MENSKNNNSLKAIIAILCIALLGCLVYIFQLKSQSTTLETQVLSVKTEKENVLKDLESLKTTYDQAIAQNTTITDELTAEREKVVGLMAQLEKSNSKTVDFSKYKRQVTSLQLKMKELMQEVVVLKTQNKQLTTNLDSTNVVLEDTKNYTKTLVGQNEELAKTIEKGSKLSVLNLQTSTYKLKSSGKEVATDKANRVDFMRIAFTIAENNIAKQDDKIYYIQIIDSKNNVIGDKATISFDEKSLTYSFTASVKYENKTVQVSKDLAGKNFESGTYFVNVFDKAELVSKSSFVLR